MFSLIFAVVGISLLVLLTAATLYYGGDSYADSQKQASAAAIINQSQQISGAVEMFKAENPKEQLNTMADLVPNYLKSTPNGWELSSIVLTDKPGFVAYPIPGTDDNKKNICEEVNKKLGVTGPIPACTSISANFSGCCTSS